MHYKKNSMWEIQRKEWLQNKTNVGDKAYTVFILCEIQLYTLDNW